MKKLIFIADYCADPLATNEALLAIRRHTKKPFEVNTVAARPFNTLSTGFLLEQLSRRLSPAEAKNTVFFLNTDPRIHTTGATDDAEGASLVAAFLKNGAVVLATNSGWCLSFAKHFIQRVAEVRVSKKGSQFRSRDIFPPVVAAALTGSLSSKCLKPLATNSIPERPDEHVVLHVDNYGNIKLSLTKRDLEGFGIGWGDWTGVRIGKGKPVRARVLPTIFADGPGTLVIAPGSSGDPRNPYCELSVRFDGDHKRSAASLFGWPDPGTKLQILKRQKE